jgi:hypothetical protein
VASEHRAVFEPFYRSLTRACEEAESWPFGVIAAIGITLDFAVEQPEQAQLLTMDAGLRRPEIAGELEESIARFADLLSTGRRLNEEAAELPAVTEWVLIGAVSWVVSTRLPDERSEDLPALKAELARFTLTPFIGSDQAARVVAEQA